MEDLPEFYSRVSPNPSYIPGELGLLDSDVEGSGSGLGCFVFFFRRFLGFKGV